MFILLASSFGAIVLLLFSFCTLSSHFSPLSSHLSPLLTKCFSEVSPHITFNFTVPFTGVYEVIMMADNNNDSSSAPFGKILGFLYSSSFDSYASCSNYVRELSQENNAQYIGGMEERIRK